MPKKNALMGLAWSMLPEKAIIARLANQLVKHQENHYYYGRDVKQFELKEAVRKTQPPYGYLKKRVEALPAEISRQNEIRRKRRLSREVPETPSLQVRRNIVADRLTGRRGNCFYVRRIGATRIVIQSHNHELFVDLIRNDGKRACFRATYYQGYAYVPCFRTTLVNIFHSVDGSEALVEETRAGASIRLNFDLWLTEVTYTDGRVARLPWDRSASCTVVSAP